MIYQQLRKIVIVKFKILHNIFGDKKRERLVEVGDIVVIDNLSCHKISSIK